MVLDVSWRMSPRGISNSFLFLGCLLSIFAIATLLSREIHFEDTCRRYCWVFELLNAIIGSQGVRFGFFLFWGALAALCLARGIVLRRHSLNHNNVENKMTDD